MKKLLTFLFLLTAGILSAADWLIGAEYRLEVRRDTADKVCAVDLRRLLLPVKLTHGVVVTDDKQEPVNFYLDDRQCLFLPPGQKGKYYIYFGFPQPVRNDNWDQQKHGALPDNQMLTVKLAHAYGLAPSEAEWLEMKKNNINRRYTNHLAWQQRALFWQSLYCAMPVIFSRYSPEYWIHLTFYRQAIIIQERYNRFRSLASKAQTWRLRKASKRYKPRPPIFRCGTWLQAWLPQYQRSNFLYRNRNTMIHMRRMSEKWRDELAQLTKDIKGAPERELLNHFSNPKLRIFGEDIAREINLPKRPFDAGGTFACRYQGALHIPETGKYEFGITSNSLTMLKLGDEVITVRSGRSAPDEVVTQTINRELKKGLYPFGLFYLKTQVTTHLTMTWKKPGDTRHAIMNDLAFRPAIPLRPTAICSRTGDQYPVVEREDRLELFYGKLHKAEFAGFEVLAPQGLKYHWLVNGEKVPDAISRLALPEKNPAQVQFIPQDRRYKPLPVWNSVATGTRLFVDSGVWLHLDLPITQKHDETLFGCRDLRSRLTIPVTVRLRTKVTGGKSKVFRNGDEYIHLENKLPEELDRFAEDRSHRTMLNLDGTDLIKGLRVEWEAAVPEVVFDRRTVHFLPVVQLPADLAATAEGFVNGTGERVIPVLRRPGLHDLRSGESLRAVQNALMPGRKLLIITEDFGIRKNFAKAAANAFRKAGWEPEILCWKNSSRNSGSRILDSVPELLRTIHGSPAETVLLIPPAPARDAVLPDREKLRMNALLLEKIRTLPKMRRLILATPLPAYGEVNRHAENGYRSALQILAREYGAQWFDWGKRVMTGLRDYDQAFGNAAGGVMSSYPEQAAEQLAELLAAEFPRR